ncbi:hypothetical protein [Peribacillus huizhouensis]|uniref:Uncharacterized protein n=1 Tax=Peribacillus huizhouensis TaxID=1501239 RepID=A0ABR6CXC9_9BACI|nr:hypothetical protein [Peribacillus huizhouensis]MBA9028992.1 hypothetical protein [Peribacillus huizhouensis]
MGAMDTVMLSDLFGGISNSIVKIAGISLLFLIRHYFKDINGFVFWLLFILGIMLFLGLVVAFVD